MKKVDYNYSNYAIVLPDGMILFGNTMIDFLLVLIEDKKSGKLFMHSFHEIIAGNLSNHYIDIGDGSMIEVLTRSKLNMSRNPVICN